MFQSVTAIYFSPTGNTKQSVEAMANSMVDTVVSLDLTVQDPSEPKQFTKSDFVIFGAPVYGGRIPTVAAKRFSAMRGDQTPCLIAVTFGNRDFDDALLELSDLAAAQGFLVKGAAALVGRHTYGEIQVTRPDAADLAETRSFAAQAAANSHAAPQIPGNHPYRDGGGGGRFRPLTGTACTKCGRCVKECPAQAIDEDCITVLGSCLSCFRCIRECPVQAKHMETEEYRAFAAMFTEKLKEKKENRFFL